MRKKYVYISFCSYYICVFLCTCVSVWMWMRVWIEQKKNIIKNGSTGELLEALLRVFEHLLGPPLILHVCRTHQEATKPELWKQSLWEETKKERGGNMHMNILWVLQRPVSMMIIPDIIDMITPELPPEHTPSPGPLPTPEGLFQSS